MIHLTMQQIYDWFDRLSKEDLQKKGNKYNIESSSKKALSSNVVSSSYVYIITFYDYEHDIIKHTFTNELTAINKHKELQENRNWGYYNLHKKLIE